MIRINHLLATLLALSSISFTSMAASLNDLQQDIQIEASSQSADIKNKRVVYKGPVVVRQGSIEMKADELSAKQDSGQTILIATGNPATYKQMLENNIPAKASAKEIRYDINKRVLTLIGKAQIEQGDSKVSADRIVYDITNQQLNAQGNTQQKDRVITIIKPESFQQSNKKELN